MRDPSAMREAMRHQDIAMSQLENHPEGFNALRRMYEEVQVYTLRFCCLEYPYIYNYM